MIRNPGDPSLRRRSAMTERRWRRRPARPCSQAGERFHALETQREGRAADRSGLSIVSAYDAVFTPLGTNCAHLGRSPWRSSRESGANTGAGAAAQPSKAGKPPPRSRLAPARNISLLRGPVRLPSSAIQHDNATIKAQRYQPRGHCGSGQVLLGRSRRSVREALIGERFAPFRGRDVWRGFV